MFLSQIVVCITCIYTLVKFKQNTATSSSDKNSVTLRIVADTIDDETKVHDLIGHNDNQTYQSADTSQKTAPATYEEIDLKK